MERIPSGGNKTQVFPHKLQLLIASVTLSALVGCFNDDGNRASVGQGIPTNENSPGTELSEIHSRKIEFDAKIAKIHSKYGIDIKVGAPEHTLYAIGEIKRGNDEKKSSEPIMNTITHFDAKVWSRLSTMVDTLEKVFGIYDPDFLSLLKTVYIADDIDNADGFANPHTIPVGIEAGNRSITIPSGERYSLENIEIITHHEITHQLHLSRPEPWPFESSETAKWRSAEQYPMGFARSYGLKNAKEDAATIGEALMSYFIKEGGIYNIPERMKKDTLLAKKIMFMTGAYYDMKEGRFTKDFSLEEFQKFFNVPDLKELPFYARMRSDTKYNYKFWNKAMLIGYDKENR